MKENLKNGSPIVVSACASEQVQTRVTISHEEIVALAFPYWQERGCQGGAAEDDWPRAEQSLIATAAKAIPTEPATSACFNVELRPMKAMVSERVEIPSGTLAPGAKLETNRQNPFVAPLPEVTSTVFPMEGIFRSSPATKRAC